MSFRIPILSACLTACFLCPLDVVSAQRPKKIADPDPMTLMTKDGVTLHCVYYPGGIVEKTKTVGKKKESEFSTIPGKEVVPVVLLHAFGGQGSEFDALASYLQRRGHAVVVPDLRGHGRSTSVRTLTGERELRFDMMRTAELQSTVNDVEAVKKFLLEKNNAGKINIEMLCLVGAESGAIFAMNYAALDWNRRQLPSRKQGRDVKALVLLSPPISSKGISLTPALNDRFAPRLSIMTIVGTEDRSGFSDVRQLHKRLARFHPEPPPEEVLDKKDLFDIRKNVRLAGTDLVHPRVMQGLRTHIDIEKFIILRLVNKKSLFPWQDRTNPLEAASE